MSLSAWPLQRPDSRLAPVLAPSTPLMSPSLCPHMSLSACPHMSLSAWTSPDDGRAAPPRAANPVPRRASALPQVLVSLRALPSQPHLLHVGELRLATSWNQNCRGHVYVPADLLAAERADFALGAAQLLAHLLCSDGVCTLPPALQWPAGSVLRLPRS